MANDIRTQSAPYESFEDLEPGALFRWIGQSDKQEVFIKIDPLHSDGPGGVSLKNGRGERHYGRAVYRVKKVTLTSPGEDNG